MTAAADPTRDPVVRIDALTAEYRTRRGVVRALDEVSLDVRPGELLAIVGESGSGKSTLSQAIGRLLPRACRLVSGTVRVLERDVAALDDAGIRRLRREQLGFIPQDPIASLDPTMRIGRQLHLAIAPLGRPTDRATLVSLLESVRIADPERALGLFPHEVSGGMAQRIAIAMAMAREPRILVADEPTGSLDAQVREEILDLIVRLTRESGASLIWVSHDLGAVRRWCERVCVMHRGRIVEEGPVSEVLTDPSHPYTRTLLAALPSAPAPAADGPDEGTETT
ncbi:ABC transporter ATP-binding protein [Leucobacter weissii]|uniref:ABC transporter ATP-binding protein n=1 Tax=Leucobacter weissii TaxID=1983706 RepID=A0A939MNU4_9MICO|nr:ABC transporter ATP-binding protein [Leucobacter weissii]MBO1900334.1 ABC transporter ATP-binding protein [Leucobacter weissii]